MGTFVAVVALLAWLVLAGLNYLVWAGSKASGNMMMLIGASLNVLVFLLVLAREMGDLVAVLSLLGMILFTYGFFVSVKPTVQAQLAAMSEKAAAAEKAQAKAQDEDDEKKGDG